MNIPPQLQQAWFEREDRIRELEAALKIAIDAVNGEGEQAVDAWALWEALCNGAAPSPSVGRLLISYEDIQAAVALVEAAK